MQASKAAASLSSALLARKGAARPAMRRQPVGLGPRAVLDDLGWNDMGEAVPPAPSPVAEHLAAIEAAIVDEAPVAEAPVAEVTAAPERRSAFTLRLDAERHLRLRLLSAVTNRSAQRLLLEALDSLIAAHPDVDQLAADPKARAGL